jgi:hypothetical protein
MLSLPVLARKHQLERRMEASGCFSFPVKVQRYESRHLEENRRAGLSYPSILWLFEFDPREGAVSWSWEEDETFSLYTKGSVYHRLLRKGMSEKERQEKQKISFDGTLWAVGKEEAKLLPHEFTFFVKEDPSNLMYRLEKTLEGSVLSVHSADITIVNDQASLDVVFASDMASYPQLASPFF